MSSLEIFHTDEDTFEIISTEEVGDYENLKDNVEISDPFEYAYLSLELSSTFNNQANDVNYHESYNYGNKENQMINEDIPIVKKEKSIPSENVESIISTEQNDISLLFHYKDEPNIITIKNIVYEIFNSIHNDIFGSTLNDIDEVLRNLNNHFNETGESLQKFRSSFDYFFYSKLLIDSEELYFDKLRYMISEDENDDRIDDFAITIENYFYNILYLKSCNTNMNSEEYWNLSPNHIKKFFAIFGVTIKSTGKFLTNG